jgi:hypothetical protein
MKDEGEPLATSNEQPATAASRSDAAFRLRRVSSSMTAVRIVPFPGDCLTITIRPPSPKLTDGAGTRHRSEQSEWYMQLVNIININSIHVY